MESNTPLLNTAFRTATGRSNIRARNMYSARKRSANILNKYNKTMKNYSSLARGQAHFNNATTNNNGSIIESVYSNNISVNSITSPVSYSPKSINVINEEIQLGPDNLSRPNIPLNAIKDSAVKKWLKANPGDWKRITQLWEQEKSNKGLNAHATLPPKFVQAKVLEMVLNQSGGYSRRRRRPARKSRRSNRK